MSRIKIKKKINRIKLVYLDKALNHKNKKKNHYSITFNLKNQRLANLLNNKFKKKNKKILC